jgi:hypothetical protein
MPTEFCAVKWRNTRLGIDRYGVSVFTKTGLEHTFVFNGREEIIEFITAQAKKQGESKSSSARKHEKKPANALFYGLFGQRTVILIEMNPPAFRGFKLR